MLVLREAFCRHYICTQEGIQLLNGATVPIIKLVDRRTDVKVDMSFNMNNGLRSAQLILVCFKFEKKTRIMVTKIYLLKNGDGIKPKIGPRTFLKIFVGDLNTANLLILLALITLRIIFLNNLYTIPMLTNSSNFSSTHRPSKQHGPCIPVEFKSPFSYKRKNSSFEKNQITHLDFFRTDRP